MLRLEMAEYVDAFKTELVRIRGGAPSAGEPGYASLGRVSGTSARPPRHAWFPMIMQECLTTSWRTPTERCSR